MKKNTTTRKLKEPTISDVLDAMSTMAKRIDERFEKADQRFVDLEGKMDKRFEGIDQRFDQVDKRFIDLENRMNHRFLDLESRMDSRFVDLEDRMNHKFDLMENQIDGLAKQTKDIYDEQRSLVKLYKYLYDKVEIHDRAILSLKSNRT